MFPSKEDGNGPCGGDTGRRKTEWDIESQFVDSRHDNGG